MTNRYDKPVDNAAVILDFLGSHQFTKLGKRKPIHWEVHTNQKGIAHFPPIPQAPFSFRSSRKNIRPTARRSMSTALKRRSIFSCYRRKVNTARTNR